MRRAAALVVLLGGLVSNAAAQTADPGELSSIAQAAAQRGITVCLPPIDRLAKTLAENYSIGVFLFNQLDRPDEGLLSISMELTPSPSGGAVYLSASFVPTPQRNCQVMVETTLHWDSKCEAVGMAYPGYATESVLLQQIRVLSAQGTERLFLMPTIDGGCISVEKSVYF